MSKFRILILDDVVFEGVEESRELCTKYNWGQIGLNVLDELSESDVYIAKKAALNEVRDFRNWKSINTSSEKLLTDFLGSLDVVVLDLSGIGSIRSSDNFKSCVNHNFSEIGLEAPCLSKFIQDKKYDGLEFFHTYLQKFGTNCLIVILSQYADDDDEVLKLFLQPFTVFREDAKSQRYVVEYQKDTATNVPLGSHIDAHYDFCQSGLSDATNRAQISFAAAHSNPVMIVGESGTGKEGIAQFIHQRWCKRQGIVDKTEIAKRLQVVNCGGLSEQLARAELFGFLRGSFTGAEESRLGAVLLAAGISPIGKKQPSAKDSEEFKEVIEILEEFSKSLKEFDAKSSDEERVRCFNDKVLRPFTQLFSMNSGGHAKRLSDALYFAEAKLKNAVTGATTTNDFREEILQKSHGRLEKRETDSYDLHYSQEEPWGTLFLDEFGDLPLSIQTLLLRFLQNGEVQPMGYAGRILGVKSRIIVATSDRRIACFAGQELNDDFRSKEEQERPLRADLLHRICFQVIRAEAVTKHNLEEILRNMIKSRNEGLGALEKVVEWDKFAVDFVVTEIEKAVFTSEPSDSVGVDGAIRKVSFGHRRELRRIVDLVATYAALASSIGVRDPDLAVTKRGYLVKTKAVRRLWRPSMLVVRSDSYPHLAVSESEKNEPDQFEVERLIVKFLEELDRCSCDASPCRCHKLGEMLRNETNWAWRTHILNVPEFMQDRKRVQAAIKAVVNARGSEVCKFFALEGPGGRLSSIPKNLGSHLTDKAGSFSEEKVKSRLNKIGKR